MRGQICKDCGCLYFPGSVTGRCVFCQFLAQGWQELEDMAREFTQDDGSPLVEEL